VAVGWWRQQRRREADISNCHWCVIPVGVRCHNRHWDILYTIRLLPRIHTMLLDPLWEFMPVQTVGKLGKGGGGRFLSCFPPKDLAPGEQLQNWSHLWGQLHAWPYFLRFACLTPFFQTEWMDWPHAAPFGILNSVNSMVKRTYLALHDCPYFSMYIWINDPTIRIKVSSMFALQQNLSNSFMACYNVLTIV
jgi:hypothetical protein